MLVETSSATLTDPSMEGSETVFSLRFGIEIFWRYVNGASVETLEFLERAKVIWMPGWESALTFVAFEKHHICKWLESLLDMLQQPSSEVRADFHRPYRHIGFAADCEFCRKSVISIFRFFGP